MIDIHTHILYGIDDGSTSLEESITILEKLKDLGFTSVVATPHYIEGSIYNANNETKIDLITRIYRELRERKIDIKIYLGNEIFVFDALEEFLEKDEIYKINDGKYMLIELPFHNYPVQLENYIFKLINHDIIPIIAHPERYTYFAKDPTPMIALMKQGVLFQCNFESILGKYGSKSKELFIFLLENNMVHMLATDVHKERGQIFETFEEAKQKIINQIGEDKFIELTKTNPRNVLRNVDIDFLVPELSKKVNFFSFLHKEHTK